MNKTSIIFSGLLMAVSVSALAAKDIDISSSHWKKSRHTHKRKRHEPTSNFPAEARK